MKKRKEKVDLLSYIRNGQELTLKQKLRLVATLSTPAVLPDYIYYDAVY